MVLQSELLQQSVCHHISTTNVTIQNCGSNHEVSGKTAVWLGRSDSVMGITSAFTAGTLGSFSDKIGRKPIMLISMIGSIGYLFVLLATVMLDLTPVYVV
jgi:MFS family permease